MALWKGAIMDGVLLVAALLPAAILMVYVYHKDTVEKEPVGLIVRVFLLGVVAGPVAAVIETVAFGVFEAVLPAGAVLLVLEYFVGVAAVEEALKYAALSTIRKNPAFNYVFDGIVYAVAAALGFAALENVLYVFDGGLEVALTRAVFSVPGHCADGVVMGCFYGLARQREVMGNASGARTYYLLAFLLPVIEHGFYDCALSFESDLMVLLALAVEIGFIIFAMVLVHRISKNDSPIPVNPTPQPVAFQQQAPQPQAPQQYTPQAAPMPPMAPTPATWTCPRCGQPNAGNFCGNCGTPRPM